VTIYHWWTSGGEAAAINALVAYFNTLYPNISVIQSPVAGGAGYVFKSVIKPLVLAGEAPDAFQMHAGYEGAPYYAGGYLEPITNLWVAQNWEHYIPPVVAAMCKFGSDYYAVPVNIHRVNVLWYNKPILHANGIDPATLTTWTALFAACDTIIANATNGISKPIALGDSGAWAAEHVFEQILASEGMGFYQDWANGKVTSATNATLLDALTKFGTYLGYVNTNHAALSWDQATARLIANTSVFNIMGDWANGEFLKAGKTFNVFYGAQASPGTSGDYGLCIDCFQHPKGVQHPANSLLWLTVVGSKDGQDTFNPLKGSIAARNDSDITKYGPYQATVAIPDFKAATHMFPSMTHGSALPETVAGDVTTAIGTFVSSAHDAAARTAAATAMTDSMVSNHADFTTTWSL
jgi:glucose/mannose transport system substrate-binding protein